jgi:microcystin-dependent protein
MANPFVAEVRPFPFNFAPKGWAFCNGQLMPISQNTALFSLLGTTYGGDGKSTFALPNLQGSLANSFGQGAGLSPYDMGQQSGVNNVTLLVSEMPSHTHTFKADTDNGPDNDSPANAAISSGGAALIYTDAPSPITQFAFQTLSVAGSSLPHNNLMPYLTLNFCIALQGVFPARP